MGGTILGFGADEQVTGTASSEWSETSSSAHAVSITGETTDGWTTPGTPDYFNPVNHDEDIIWIWLNPVLQFTIDPSNPDATPVWNGYGYDMCDPHNGIDVVGIKVGYLNGDIQDSQSQFILSRSWVTQSPCPVYYFPNGDVPALTTTDYQNILTADPFTNPSYSVLPPPGSGVTTTSDGRYTQAIDSNTGSPASIYYLQENPQWHFIYQQSLTNSTTNTQDSTNSTKISWSVANDVKGHFFWTSLEYKLTYSGSVTMTNEKKTSDTTTSSSTDTATIYGPTCSANPCSPAYSGVAPSQPSSFNVYQDNLYNSYMFYGVN